MLLKVVVVEDEEIIRKGMIFSINWLDMECIVAGSAQDGQEGLEVIRRVQPDVVLTDILMPRMSGLEMIEQALTEYQFYSIVLTSYSEFELAKRALQIGVADYLLKPVDEEELRVVLEKIRNQIIYNNRYKKIEELSQDRILTAYDDWRLFESAAGSGDFYVKRTYEIVKERYMEKLSISSVAEELGVSSSYLSRKLKASLNVTFVDLLNQYRIKEALKLLSQGTMRIYEVSDQVGFSGYKYFCSVFKKYTNISPSEFLKDGIFLSREEQ